ncbi:MAG: BREX-1 system adenine-specific DNA-methyltransferase PglX [Desulfovibrio alaskensis]|nr:BREX-1 system adenine-specific DNA-methyltransferase PglX [Oleidesulfovibrio alaskensis]
MNRNILKSYAPKARREFIQAVTDRASVLGLSAKKIEPVEVKGDVAIIAGRPFPKDVAERRKKLEERIKIKGFQQVMETVAYTWFNRFCALRYMELHDYLGHGYRVLSNPSGSDIPEILEKATSVDLPGLDKNKVAELRLAGDKDAELYRLLLVTQCNALHRAMPMMFEAVHGASELLLPENLLQTNSPIRKLVNDIPEENWSEIEIVGWLYQFYISEKKDQVIGKVVKSEDIPAATQLFTPNWIVKYMVQNTLGRKWLMTYPASGIKGKMEFYIEPAEQEPEVQAKLNAITPKELNPEELTFMDPACGSGHILAEAYGLFKEIYLERGYRTRDIPRLILEKNLYGLDIDDRAAQLARFTVLMKARADDRRILDPENPAKLNIIAIQESKGLDADEVARVLLREQVKEIGGKREAKQLSLMQPTTIQASLSDTEKPNVTKEELYSLLHLFEDGKTFGSLLTVHDRLKDALPRLEKLVAKALQASDMESRGYGEALSPLVNQAIFLSIQYDYLVTNPPYMGSKYYNPDLKKYIQSEYKDEKADLYSAFIVSNLMRTKAYGFVGMITIPNWMFLSSFEVMRDRLVSKTTLDTLVHVGRGLWGSDFGSCAFAIRNCYIKDYKTLCKRLFEKQGSVTPEKELVKRYFEKDNIISKTSMFSNIPGSPIAYWATDGCVKSFLDNPPIADILSPRQGMATGDNNRFVREWFEVSFTKIGLGIESKDEAFMSQKTWFPYNKGGSFLKWYGNRDHVVRFDREAYAILKQQGNHCPSEELYFKDNVGWSKVSIGNAAFRVYEGFVFDVAGCSIFGGTSKQRLRVLGFLNSHAARLFLSLLSPTMNYEVGTIKKLPVGSYYHEDCSAVDSLVKRMVEISKFCWDSSETSWGFTSIDIISSSNGHERICDTLFECQTKWDLLTKEMHELENKSGKFYIDAYGLYDEVVAEVPLSEITLNCNPFFRFGDKSDEEHSIQQRSTAITELISYAIGCMMGRYSLDEPGLIYAHSGNEGFDPSRYTTFPADEDGIVPVMDDDWFEDDATNRFEEFLKVAWSPETLDENLKFVADSLDPKRGEAPTETIRRFISQKFFKDHHLKVYKKRPIYWLFSSGKQRAFECLVYLHRYNENTLARMRAMYVTPLQGKYNARIDYLDKEKDNAGSATATRKLQKELDTMRKKQQELREFDELLRHYADQRISLDLDDGVKVNYGKFGKLLAEVKSVTGSNPQ